MRKLRDIEQYIFFKAEEREGVKERKEVSLPSNGGRRMWIISG